MVTNVKDLMATANAEVPRISVEEARRMVAQQNALIVDVHDMPELEATGRIPGSIHIPPGMLLFGRMPQHTVTTLI